MPKSFDQFINIINIGSSGNQTPSSNKDFMVGLYREYTQGWKTGFKKPRFLRFFKKP